MRIIVFLFTIVFCSFLLWIILPAENEVPIRQDVQPTRIGASGLPIPRFVSIKTGRANVRTGPSKSHEISWIFKRKGLPVEIIAEFEHWRRIRDSDGSEGWIFHSLLSGQRTATIAPWIKTRTVPLRNENNVDAQILAHIEPNVSGVVKQCDRQWCYMDINGIRGWIEQSKLWGVYSGEKIE